MSRWRRDTKSQINLMMLVDAMKPGTACRISYGDMAEAAAGELRSALDGPVRESDVRQFVAKIETNWDLRVTREPITDRFTLYKKDPDLKGSIEVGTTPPFTKASNGRRSNLQPERQPNP